MAYTNLMPIDPKLKSSSVPLVAGDKTRLHIDRLIAEPGRLGQKVSAHNVKIPTPSTPVIGPHRQQKNARLGNSRPLWQFAKEVVNGSL